MPVMSQSLSLISEAVEIGDFVKRLKDGLCAFAGIERTDSDKAPLPSGEVAAELAALVKPLAGRPGSRLDVAYVKYRSRSKDRLVEIEASFGSEEIDRIAVNAERALEVDGPRLIEEESSNDTAPSLLRKAVLSLQQANTGPAKEKGKTNDRGVINSISEKPLPVYFAKTMNDLKSKMVGRSSNPFIKPFRVDALVTYENGEPKSYTVIDVHGPYRQRKKKGPPDLLSQAAS